MASSSSSSMGSSSPSSGVGTFSSLQFYVSISSEENSLDPKTSFPNSVKFFQPSPRVRIVGFKLPAPTTRSSPVCLHTLLSFKLRWLNISLHIEQWCPKSFTCTQECDPRDCVKCSIIAEEMKALKCLQVEIFRVDNSVIFWRVGYLVIFLWFSLECSLIMRALQNNFLLLISTFCVFHLTCQCLPDGLCSLAFYSHFQIEMLVGWLVGYLN